MIDNWTWIGGFAMAELGTSSKPLLFGDDGSVQYGK